MAMRNREDDGMITKVVSINRVSKTVKGGRIMKFAALVVVGDGRGTIGYGIGKSGEVPEAIRKGEAAAKKNMHKVALKGTTILNAVVEGNPTKEEINAQMKAQATESFGYNEDEIVSSDIIGMRFGSLFDATQTMVINLGNGTSQVQVVSWYDNENSYTSQMVRTIKYFAENC